MRSMSTGRCALLPARQYITEICLRNLAALDGVSTLPAVAALKLG